MIKLFLRVVYISFLWIILLANLYFFFNFSHELVTPSGIDIDTTGRYFGISTLIDAFKDLPNTPLARFTEGVKDFQYQLFKVANNLISNNTLTSQEELVFNYAYNNDIFSLVQVMFQSIIQIGMTIASVVVFIVAMFVTMFYYACMIMEIVYFIITLFQGAYSSPVPHSQLLDDGVIRNCITPLLTAV